MPEGDASNAGRPAAIRTVTLLTPDRFRRIDSLLDAALERPATERAAFLDSACADDAGARREVDRMLDSMDAAASWLGEHVAEFAAPLVGSLGGRVAAPLVAGDRLGPWRIETEIGHGGMGTVYLAVRADGDFAMRAAIKVVARPDSAEVLRRFTAERRILASLEHRNIARLLDGGATNDGRPWLAMELVDGKPIDQWCDDRQLGVRDRLSLFRDVCLAVHHAHRSLVVHRDVKPSNILVTADGTPKLLDFGIAKILDDNASPDAGARTIVRALTPEYAAPEQLADRPITTATDVYALGVVLHELLVGRRPRTLDGLRFEEILRTLDSEPAPPSSHVDSTMRGDIGGAIARARATTPDRLHATLRGDLDTIVLHALAPEPARRYGSALQLAEDITRYLTGMPIAARPDDWRYRSSRFVQRHRAAVAAGAAFVVLLIVIGASMAAAQRRTARAFATARAEQVKAVEVSDFLKSMFTASNPLATSPERLDTLRVAALLERGAARAIEQLDDQPAVQANLLAAIAQAWVGMGRYAAADTAVRRAISLARADGSDPGVLADALNTLGVLGLSTDRSAEAETALHESLRIRRELLVPDDDRVIAAMSNLAAALQNQDRFEEARTVYDSALSITRNATPIDSARLADLLNGRAMLATRLGDAGTAIDMMREILAIQRERAGSDHPSTLIALHNLATMMRNAGRPADAEPLQREALALTRRQLGNDHPRTADAIIGLARNLALLSRNAEAGSLFVEGITILRSVYAGRPSADLARALSQYSDLHLVIGDTAAAERPAAEAVEMNLAAMGPGHPFTAITRLKLAVIRCAHGEHDEAERLYAAAQDVIDTATAPGDTWRIQVRVGRGDCLIRARNFAAAEASLVAAWEVASGGPDRDSRTPAIARRLVRLYEAWGRPDRAAPYRAAARPGS